MERSSTARFAARIFAATRFIRRRGLNHTIFKFMFPYLMWLWYKGVLNSCFRFALRVSRHNVLLWYNFTIYIKSSRPTWHPPSLSLFHVCFALSVSRLILSITLGQRCGDGRSRLKSHLASALLIHLPVVAITHSHGSRHEKKHKVFKSESVSVFYGTRKRIFNVPSGVCACQSLIFRWDLCLPIFVFSLLHFFLASVSRGLHGW